MRVHVHVLDACRVVGHTVSMLRLPKRITCVPFVRESRTLPTPQIEAYAIRVCVVCKSWHPLNNDVHEHDEAYIEEQLSALDLRVILKG